MKSLVESIRGRSNIWELRICFALRGLAQMTVCVALLLSMAEPALAQPTKKPWRTILVEDKLPQAGNAPVHSVLTGTKWESCSEQNGFPSGIAIRIQPSRTEVVRIAGAFMLQGDSGKPFGLGFWSVEGGTQRFHGVLIRPSDGSVQLVKYSGSGAAVIESSAQNVDSMPSRYPAAKWHAAGKHVLLYNVDLLNGNLIGSVTLDRYTYTLPSAKGSWSADQVTHAGTAIAGTGNGAPTLEAFQVMTFAQSAAPAHFSHPGLLSSQGDFDRIRAKLKAHEEPWTTGLQQLQASPFSLASYKMTGPFATVTRDKGASPHRAEYERDVIAAYQNALLWAITGDSAHATKANEILSAYAHNLQQLNGSDVQLLASLTGHLFVNAAEIMRHTNSGWNEDDAKLFGQMLMTKYYPLIANISDGNWGTGCLKTIMAIGIYNDDPALFLQAENAFKYGVGGRNRVGVEEYILASGQSGESGRDQGHAQLGIAHLAEAAQEAWNQGVDLYSWGDNRLLTGFNYAAAYNLGVDSFPFETFGTGQGPQFSVISSQGRGSLRPIYEMVYNHYHVLEHIPTPVLVQALQKLRPEGALPIPQMGDHPGFGSLLFALEPSLGTAAAAPVTPPETASRAPN